MERSTLSAPTEGFHKDGCMALGLFTSKSPAQGHTLANLAGPEREHEIVHGAKVLEATVVSAVLVVDEKTSVTGASCVTRQRLFHLSENRRCRVTWCSSDSNCGGSSAQLQVYVVHVPPCFLCALRVGTPCFCSQPPMNISTAEFARGGFIFACNVLTIATELTKEAVGHLKQRCRYPPPAPGVEVAQAQLWAGFETASAPSLTLRRHFCQLLRQRRTVDAVSLIHHRRRKPEPSPIRDGERSTIGSMG